MIFIGQTTLSISFFHGMSSIRLSSFQILGLSCLFKGENYSTTLKALFSGITRLLYPCHHEEFTNFATDYNEFLKYKTIQQISSPAAIAAQSGNFVAVVNKSSSLGPWGA